MADLKIIDGHHHLWDLENNPYSWLTGEEHEIAARRFSLRCNSSGNSSPRKSSPQRSSSSASTIPAFVSSASISACKRAASLPIRS